MMYDYTLTGTHENRSVRGYSWSGYFISTHPTSCSFSQNVTIEWDSINEEYFTELSTRMGSSSNFYLVQSLSSIKCRYK